MMLGWACGSLARSGKTREPGLRVRTTSRNVIACRFGAALWQSGSEGAYGGIDDGLAVQA